MKTFIMQCHPWPGNYFTKKPVIVTAASLANCATRWENHLPSRHFTSSNLTIETVEQGMKYI